MSKGRVLIKTLRTSLLMW